VGGAGVSRFLKKTFCPDILIEVLHVSLSRLSGTTHRSKFFLQNRRLDLDTPRGGVCAEPALTLCCFFDVISSPLFDWNCSCRALQSPPVPFGKAPARRRASGARLLSIIALCNSLGLRGWIAGAACIRCGYVKLLGVSFFWRCFVL